MLQRTTLRIIPNFLSRCLASPSKKTQRLQRRLSASLPKSHRNKRIARPGLKNPLGKSPAHSNGASPCAADTYKRIGDQTEWSRMPRPCATAEVHDDAARSCLAKVDMGSPGSRASRRTDRSPRSRKGRHGSVAPDRVWGLGDIPRQYAAHRGTGFGDPHLTGTLARKRPRTGLVGSEDRTYASIGAGSSQSTHPIGKLNGFPMLIASA